MGGYTPALPLRAPFVTDSSAAGARESSGHKLVRQKVVETLPGGWTQPDEDEDEGLSSDAQDGRMCPNGFSMLLIDHEKTEEDISNLFKFYNYA